MRAAPAVKLALCIAALLSIGAAFGIHREPIVNGALEAAASGLSAVRTVSAPHGCFACLTHGAALASPRSGIAFTSAASAPGSLFADPVPGGRLAGRDLSGRSPPARS
ncbi:MAG: hypothetical protein ACRD3M_15280 [Thermoanaerobaculia bacterium]